MEEKNYYEKWKREEDILGRCKEITGGDGGKGEDGGGDETTERGDVTCGIFGSN